MRMASRVPGHGLWAAGSGRRAASCGRRASGQKRCALRATGQTHRFGLASLCDASPSSTGRIGLHMADMLAAAKADPNGFVGEVKRVSVNFPVLTSSVHARKRPGGNLPRPWCSADGETSAGFGEGMHAIPMRMSWEKTSRNRTALQTIDRQQARCDRTRPRTRRKCLQTQRRSAFWPAARRPPPAARRPPPAARRPPPAARRPPPAARRPPPATSRSCTRDRRFVRRRIRASRSSRRRACSAS